MFPSTRNRSFAAEWDQQDGILIAWPHVGTDWDYMLDEVTACYVEIARAILADDDERLVIVAPDAQDVKDALGDGADWTRIDIIELPTNDTWVRDYGPITVFHDGNMRLADFTFNAWGMKFAADCDNLVTTRLNERGLFKMPLVNCRDLVLEGGSIETDGNGTVMTTTSCLIAPNRNDSLSPRRRVFSRLSRSISAFSSLTCATRAPIIMSCELMAKSRRRICRVRPDRGLCAHPRSRRPT